MVKVGFKLDRDADDYPPADWEWMWASRVGDSTFKIDNIPFFAKLISSGDSVAATYTNTGMLFQKLGQPSCHSTVRVVSLPEGGNDEQVESAVKNIRQSLRHM